MSCVAAASHFHLDPALPFPAGEEPRGAGGAGPGDGGGRGRHPVAPADGLGGAGRPLRPLPPAGPGGGRSAPVGGEEGMGRVEEWTA